MTNTKCSSVYKIDKTTPNVTFGVKTGTAGTNGWYKSDVAINVTPSAGVSSVKEYYYCKTTATSCTPNTKVTGNGVTAVTLNTESTANKVCVRVVSNAAESTKCSSSYKIDKTPPVLKVGGNTSNFSRTVTIGNYSAPSISATDNLTSSPSVTTSGSVNGSVAGRYSITYTAKDGAGNSKSVTMTVNVEDRTCSMSININWDYKENDEYRIKLNLQIRFK